VSRLAAVLLAQAEALELQARTLRALAEEDGAVVPEASPTATSSPRAPKRTKRVAVASSPGDDGDEVARMRNRKQAEDVLRRKGYPV